MYRKFLLAAAAALFVAASFTAGIVHAGAGPTHDVNNDGIINSTDMGIVASGDEERGDLNGDGVVNSVDLGLLADAYLDQLENLPAATVSFATSGAPPGDFTLQAEPTVPDDIRVEFEVDGQLVAVEDNPPYSLFGDNRFVMNSGSLGPGAHVVSADVYEQDGVVVLETGSTIVGAGSGAENTPTANATYGATPVPATSTPTRTPTPTASPLAASPTATSTSAVPTPTLTPTPQALPTATATTPQGATRDKSLWPFASTSPWNMPVGSGAVYANANIGVEGWHTENALTIMSPSSPLRPLHNVGHWWGIGCSEGSAAMQVPIPDGYVVGPPGSDGDGTLPNRPGGVLLQDGVTIQEFQYAQRCSAAGPLVAGSLRCRHSILGSGMCGFGAQGASGLSGVGGVLRVWEAQGTQPIRHALKVTLGAHMLSNCNGGYRWPAVAADGYHNSAYVGSICDVRMGSLLALPPTYACPGGTSLAARMCQAMKDYGLYIGDTHNSPGWNPLSIIGESGTSSALSAIGGTLQTYAEALQVITNNGVTSVGGGGIPRAPLAPPVGN